LTSQIKQDYETGFEIATRQFREFNDRNFFDVLSDNQMKFNSYAEGPSQDPEESWMWPGVRPITRNKVMSLAAHLTSSLIFPNVFAQNEADEEDRNMAQVMKDLVKWHILNTNYGVSFVFGIVAALVNPMTYFHIQYAQVPQKIKLKKENGEIEEIEGIDDEFSGIQVSVVPGDEVYIADPYQFNIQKQAFLIRRRYISYAEAEGLYKDHRYFKYVEPGVKALFNDEDQTFYDIRMDDAPTTCEETIYYNRQEDLEVHFINGIYMGEENVNANRMKHRTNRNKPKYPYVPLRYEPYDEGRFFFSRSAVERFIQDQDLVDMLWRLVIDATHISVKPPLAVSGNNERITPGIMTPSAVTQFNEGTKIENLGQYSNLIGGINLIRETEQSINESSQAPQQAGQAEKGAQTAYEIATLQQNARIQLGLAGKMIISAVKDLGDLLVDLIIMHQTVGEVDELSDGLKFRNFLLPDEIENGEKISKKIDFSEELIGLHLTDKEIQKRNDQLTKDTGGIDSGMYIYKINPRVFASLNYKLQVEADVLIPKNEQFEKALNLEAYDRMIMNPYADQRAVSRDFLFETLKKGESNKYMTKQPMMPQMTSQSGKSLQLQGSPLVSQMTQNQGMAGVMPGKGQ